MGQLALLLAFGAAGCSNSSDSDENSASSGATYSVDATLPADYIRGFDVSAVDYWEKDYAPAYDWADESWYDTDGSEKDFFAILASHGVNTARIRVWVDPSAENTSSIITDSWWPASASTDGAWKSGDNTTARAVSMAKRAKEAGLKVMIDFHYSDYWTDPGKQVIPRAWQSITTADEMAAKLGEYTTEVLTALKDADALPDYVQIGNEIDSGILLHSKYTGSAVTASSSVSGTIGTTAGLEHFKAYIASGCNAVRAFDASIKIILHVTNQHAGRISNLSSCDFDMIALSYYPWEQNHGAVSSLVANIQSLKAAYEKPVIIGEISAHYASDAGSADSDRAYAAEHMKDPATGAIYTDLATETVGSTVYLLGSVENQANIFRHVIEASANAGASGIVAWGGERRADWKYAFFDWDGKALSSIEVFNVQGN